MGELNYGRMMQRAMQSLMAEALSEVAENGLPGDHHFYISFMTQHPGVVVPDFLRERFPEELMIVLQHEFSDLSVTRDRFSVRLSFDSKPTTIVVPFDAICQFADPSAEFGLRFDPTDAKDRDEESESGRPAEDVFAELSRRRTGEDAEQTSAEERGDSADGAGAEGDETREKPTGDVVSLDSFRKK